MRGGNVGGFWTHCTLLMAHNPLLLRGTKYARKQENTANLLSCRIRPYGALCPTAQCCNQTHQILADDVTQVLTHHWNRD